MSLLSIIDRPRLLEQLSNHKNIALSACHGAGKTELIKQFCQYSHEDILSCLILPSHNDESQLVSFLKDQMARKQWLRSQENISTLVDLAMALQDAQRSYRSSRNKVVILDQCERLSCPGLNIALSECLVSFPESIRVIISSSNMQLKNSAQQNLGVNWTSLTNSDFQFDQPALKGIQSDYGLAQQHRISRLYQLSGGHSQILGLLLNRLDHLPDKNLQLYITQLPEIQNLFQQWLAEIEVEFYPYLLLPVHCSYLFNCIHGFNTEFKKNASWEMLLTALNADNLDDVHFQFPSLLTTWLRSECQRLALETCIFEPVQLVAICEYYCKAGFALHAVGLLDQLDQPEPVYKILIAQLLDLMRTGQYQDADKLCQRLLKRAEFSGQLLLFSVLIDFNKHGHLFALNRLNSIEKDLQNASSDIKLSQQELRSLKLFQRHCRSMLDQPAPNNNQTVQQDWIDWPLLCWDTHTLATEQLYKGELLLAEANFLLSFEQANQVKDLPCLLANLSWMYVTHLRTDKLNQFGDLYRQAEVILVKENAADYSPFQAVVKRLKIFLFIEQGQFQQADSEVRAMKECYSSLDPLNLAYCLWAEFLLLLVQQKMDKALSVISELSALNIRHYGKWSLALPAAELFKALLSREDDMALLRWANGYEQDTGNAYQHNYERHMGEFIAYLRIRITLGTDMGEGLSRLAARISEGDVLSRLQLNILELLNHDRQRRWDMAQQAMNQLLEYYSVYSLRGVYMEYQQPLLALLNDYKPVPSLFHYWQSLKQLLISAAENTINSPAAHHDSKQGQAHPAMATLTVREGEVLELLLQGKGNAEIAGELMLSQATIKGHVGRLLKKFAVLNRSQLIALQPR